jgi:hypothetical protein
VIGRHRETRRTLQAGSGAQQTRRADAEQAAEVVRNHEGGTSSTGRTVGPKGAQASGSGRVGRRTAEGCKRANPTRGRTRVSSEIARSSGRDESALKERRRSRRPTSHETETPSNRRPPATRGREIGKTSRTGLVTANGRGGGGKGETTRYRNLPLKPTQCPTGTATSTP